MRVKINGVWYDAKSDAICVELSQTERGHIADMHPDATKYAVFPDDCGMSSAQMIDWMEEETPKALPGTPRDLPTIEDHMERMQRWSIDLWEFKEMKLKHCSNVHDMDDKTELLDNIRKDAGAVLSSLRVLAKERDNGNS